MERRRAGDTVNPVGAVLPTMSTPDRGAEIPFFRPDLRSILAGLSAMLALVAAAVAAVGFAGSIPILFASGVLGAAITGWLTVDTSRVSRLYNAVLIGVVHAVVTAGFGGAVVYLSVLASPTGVSGIIASGNGGVHLLFVASPLAVVFFAAEGILGGAIGSASRLKAARR